jgi:lysophospholipase L1-like esterase
MSWKILLEPVDFGRPEYRRFFKRTFFEFGFLLSLLFVTEMTMRAAGLMLLIPRMMINTFKESDDTEFRILAIGESTTYGLGVKREDAYPEVLERLLNRSSDKKFAVFNTGVPGQTSTSILRNIRYQLEKYHPHLVISLLGANDLNEALNDMNSRRLLGLNVPGWIANLRTYRLACVLRDFVIYQPDVKEDGAWVKYDPKQVPASGVYEQNTDYLKQLELNYADIIDAVKGANAKMVILSYMRCYYAVAPCLRKIAETVEVPFLDFRSKETDGREWYTEDLFHPNEKGHRLMAEKIEALLKDNNLIEDWKKVSGP